MALSKAEKLVAIGLDSQTATRLADAGWTVAKLKRAKTPELDALGISQEVRKSLTRPPIPSDILFKVLNDSKRICCICHDPNQPIIVHHIEEWHTSRDHAKENLAVICPNDHVRVHTTSLLSQNLTPDIVRKHKADWEERVRISNAKAIIGLTRVEGANWDYVNLTRVFRHANQLNINLRAMPNFNRLLAKNLITPAGDVHPSIYSPAAPRLSMYQCGLEEGRMLYEYTSGTLEALAEKLGLVDISRASSYSELRALAEDGTLVFIQAPFYFRKDSNSDAGPGQLRTGYTKIGGVRIEFVFDGWESTSVSANSQRLSGRKVESVLGLVSGSNQTSNPPTLQISCLGIGSSFEQIHVRPTPAIGRPLYYAEEENYDEEETLASEDDQSDPQETEH